MKFSGGVGGSKTASSSSGLKSSNNLVSMLSGLSEALTVVRASLGSLVGLAVVVVERNERRGVV